MSERINNLFTRIYKRYDLMNHLFSLGTDKLWRRNVEMLALSNPECTDIIDIGAGTGDLSIGIALRAMKKDRKIRIEAVDMNEEMMSLGRSKAAAKKISSIRFARGDALDLQYVDDSFDTMVSSFVLRNLDDFNRFAEEARRVIRPGGRIILLDMALPEGPSKHLFTAYFRIMRLIGRLVVEPSVQTMLFLNLEEPVHPELKSIQRLLINFLKHMLQSEPREVFKAVCALIHHYALHRSPYPVYLRHIKHGV